MRERANMYVSRFHLISLTIWLLTSLRLSTGDQCNPSWPQGCDCVFSGGKIDIICTTYQGSTIPPGINSSVTTLRISGAPNLTNINNMDFKQATNMTQLVIENTALATIGPGSFDTMSSLTAVYLNDNQIEAIPDNLFVHTNQLQNLELQGNSIATLSNSTFTGLTSLKLLKLQKNQLTNDINSFPDGAFAKLSKLEVLDLSQNSLSAITKAIFNGLNSLVSLSLNNNTILNIELGAFNLTTNLVQLTLAQNQLTSLPDSLFRGNGVLTTLDISWNSFQGVPSNALQSAPSLEKLYLDGSLFTSIKGNTFQGLMNLKELSLSINQKLTKFEENALNGLQMLEILNVTGNPALTSFDPKVFPSRPNLKTLVLSNNSITSFQEILFSESPSFQKADISNNPLYCDCHIKWIREDMKSPEVYPWIAPWNATAICGGPQSLIGIAISQLPVEQLTCDKAKVLFSETYRGPNPAIKEAFVKRAEDFAGRPLFGIDELVAFRDQIFFADYNAKWKANKKFAMVALKQFGYGSPRLENKVLEEISTVVDKIKEHKGEGFDLLPYLCFAAARVILSITLIGHRQPTDAETDAICKLVTKFFNSSSNSELGFATMFLPMWLTKLLYKKTLKQSVQEFEDLLTYFRQYIEEHKATLDPDNPRDVLDLYIKRLDKDMTEEEVVSTVFIFIPDAIDTLSRVFTTALLYITHHPKVQVKIHEELDRVVGRTDPVRMEHKDNLPYLQAVLLETDRIAIVAPLAAPHKAVSDTTFAGYDIPKDTVMIPNLYSVHFDEDIFPNAHTFDPCHFLDDGGQVKNAEYCVPFSVGRRMCVGESLAKMEKFLLAANLFQRFSFSFPPEEPNPPYDGINIAGIFFFAKPYKICANPRT